MSKVFNLKTKVFLKIPELRFETWTTLNLLSNSMCLTEQLFKLSLTGMAAAFRASHVDMLEIQKTWISSNFKNFLQKYSNWINLTSISPQALHAPFQTLIKSCCSKVSSFIFNYFMAISSRLNVIKLSIPSAQYHFWDIKRRWSNLGFKVSNITWF